MKVFDRNRIAVQRPASPKRQFALLFLVLLTLYAGNTALQSIMPAVGRSLRLPDWQVALIFSFSAFVWSTAAPIWVRRSYRIDGRTMILIGLSGFVASLLLSGIVLSLGLLGMIPAIATFFLFIAARLIYAVLGSAGPSAAQAMVARDTEGIERTRAIAALASAVGLGTIFGPALAPFFGLPVIGLGGPGFVFAAFGLVVIWVVYRYLPANGPLISTSPAEQPVIGGEPDIEIIAEARLEPGRRKIGWLDPRIRHWLIAGLVVGHVQTAIGQIMGFLVIDRMGVAPGVAQPMIGLVLMTGAGAALIAQWGVIPRFDMTPRVLVVLGAVIGALGTVWLGFARDLHAIAIAFALASLGFGLARPGYTAGASLAVGSEDQADIAGLVTAVNGYSFVLSPAIGIVLYAIWRPLPYVVGCAALAVLVLCAYRILPRALGQSTPD